jgi:hypothetical protein
MSIFCAQRESALPEETVVGCIVESLLRLRHEVEVGIAEHLV